MPFDKRAFLFFFYLLVGFQSELQINELSLVAAGSGTVLQIVALVSLLFVF